MLPKQDQGAPRADEESAAGKRGLERGRKRSSQWRGQEDHRQELGHVEEQGHH